MGRSRLTKFELSADRVTQIHRRRETRSWQGAKRGDIDGAENEIFKQELFERWLEEINEQERLIRECPVEFEASRFHCRPVLKLPKFLKLAKPEGVGLSAQVGGLQSSPGGAERRGGQDRRKGR
jgi:hypothetical protein